VPAGGDTFAFGRTAEVLDEASGDLMTWSLVGSTESDLSAGRLSAESPVGRALRDQPVGASVSIETPRGKRTFKIERLVG
jgi:transcription elongation factor GreA